MEIKVRNLSAITVKRIDELAKKQGLSREAYLRDRLETLACLYKIKESEDRYTILVNRLMKVLEYNSLVLKRFLEENLIDINELLESERKKDV